MLAAWEASGLSIGAFAKRHEVVDARLRYWVERLTEPAVVEAPDFIPRIVESEPRPGDAPLRVRLGARAVLEVHEPERIPPRWIATLIREVFHADDVLSQLRTVQSIVTHLETFPIERAQAACRRARFYGLHSYGGIKDILCKGLDLEPLPLVVQRQSGVLDAPRFARAIGELLQLPLEKTDAPN